MFDNCNELFVTEIATDPLVITVSKYDNNDFDENVEDSITEKVSISTLSDTKTPPVLSSHHSEVNLVQPVRVAQLINELELIANDEYEFPESVNESSEPLQEQVDFSKMKDD